MAKMYASNDYKALVWILFIKRDFYVREGLKFIPKLLFEDNIFTFGCMMKAERVSHIWERYYIRRCREDSITSTNNCDIRYPYGFFLSGLNMMKMSYNFVLQPEEQMAVSKEIVRMFHCAQGQLGRLENDEINKYKEFKEFERPLFEQFVLKPWRMNKQKIKLRNSMCLALSDTKKIAEVLAEKEKNLNLLQRELIKQHNELANIKNGISFRLGRIITWLPRILFGRK